ncbi:hypothetical protein OPT61_g6773 [Boeremia exigua]|uniref:Uncharacterized protein n=1 Tax=Boeremia exigua TaxID=749465 RepID=A0ACC2I4U3_9PLEO|nr:hypothetical protein OPT61_g6773 [Boeremia exigua]
MPTTTVALVQSPRLGIAEPQPLPPRRKDRSRVEMEPMTPAEPKYHAVQSIRSAYVCTPLIRPAQGTMLPGRAQSLSPAAARVTGG